MDLTTTTDTRDALKVLNAHYTIQSGRDHAQPIVHLFCRDADRQFRHIEVEGFRPHFGVKTSVLEDRPRDLLNDRHILHLEADLRGIDIDAYDHPDDPALCAEFLTDRSNGTTVEHNPDARVALDGTDVCTVYTVEPSHVGKIREYFDRTWEADVPFERRFLIDSGIHRGVLVGDDDRVRYENWPGHSDSDRQIREIEPTDDPPAVDPRMLVVDIEVATDGGGVPDPDRAQQPVTAITAYDNYEHEYAVWVFEHNEWPETTSESVLRADIREQLDIDPDSLSVFDHEGKLLADFVEWVNERNFDLLTGWNSGGFDYPYLINRCYERSAYEVREWDRFGNPGAWRGDDDDRMNLKIDGRITWDMLDAYKKTQYRDLRSYSLGHVATAELGFGKEPIEDIDTAWKHDPTTFTTYNVRDVQAVVEIEQASGLLSLYDNLRRFVGAAYETCNNNGPMLDTLFLRRAFEENIILTTNYAPDEGDYHGAHVFDPEPGVHENVVYPDLASLYPYIMWTLNVSPETLFASQAAYREAGYSDEDVFTAYVDNRDWYTVETGESFNADEIDQSQYKGVHDQSGSRKKTSGFDGIFDPQYDEIYFLKPDVKEGFIRSTVDLLVDMKYEYKDQKDLYAAVKRITNSLYGTLGDSASGGKGFRLFDRRLGECITLTGQKVIKFTADKYVELINDYAEQAGYDRTTYLVGGDSVPEHEPTLVKKDGSVDIVPIEQVSVGDYVWSDSGWTRVNDVIKKPNRKQMYTVQTKSGITHVTEDHGLLDSTGNEQTPVETDVGDELLHEDVANIDHDNASFTEERAWLLGLFAAEGSCGIYESESGSKASWAINNTDRSVLEHAQSVMESTFGIGTKIDDVRESSNTMKLRLHKAGDNASVVLGFREMLYDGTEKRVPKEILNADPDAQKAFVAGYHTGDGHIAHEHKEFDEMWTKHRLLGCGIVYLLRQLGHRVTVDTRTEQKTEYYRIRSVAFHRGSNTEVRSIEKTEYDGEYVYDLETENHHFHAGIGSMIVHNTDSVMTAIPQAPDYQTALSWAQRASAAFQPDPETGAPGLYDTFMEDEFDVIYGQDEHKMDVEIESLGSSLFFMLDQDADRDVAVKKRYAQHLIWDEKDGWLDTDVDDPADAADASALKYRSNTTLADYETGPLSEYDPTNHIGIKGFEYVRSDSATVTKEAQLQVLTDLLLADDYSDRIHDYLGDLVDTIEAGEMAPEKIGRPKGISNQLDEYGWKSVAELRADSNYTVTEADEDAGGRYVTTPAPTYRGAKYAADHFDWEDVGEDAKPIRFYVDKVRGDEYPAVYEYDDYPQDDRPAPPEVGRQVDAIAVENPDQLPECIVLDWDTMVEKELKDKLEPILATVGEHWDDVTGRGRQTGLGAF